MADAAIFYGPMTKQQAFDVPVDSFATPIGNSWYAGTHTRVPELDELEIFAPV